MTLPSHWTRELLFDKCFWTWCFSTAFDKIDHSILFDCLQHWYGIDGVVFKCVQSYVNSRKQQIKIDGHLSDAFHLPDGVPQGSVLGPFRFTLYTTPLRSVISKFNVTHHLYADDTQIYLGLDSRIFDSSTTELANCLEPSRHGWEITNLN